ncbi:hypothetical protein N7E02_24585 [Aliirhizobium terrae]|uniref:hypothetical protein n=1 Tax=Terrirhizobium terrae TaxID=2926709 RepID=UPI002577B008|nr:hypothetical protein [Rhizobium sp. CC-CFT758]WJH39857.1 hypothetical protein N7E02_24585 [Rhizobium sp. CC-CFT758]
MSPFVVWTTIVGLILLLIYYIGRVLRTSEKEGNHDVGFAIVEFGRAFPEEAIRSLHATKDGNSIFVRLHDSKAGIMRNRRNHFACHVIHPGRVRVTPLIDVKGFSAEFLDAPTQNGEFFFRTEQEAAEVSLWLLDNYVSVEDRTLDGETAEDAEAPKPGPTS